MEFQCLMNPPKFLVKMTKHRFTFALNETEERVIPQVTEWAFGKQWLIAHINGKETHEDVLGLMSTYRIDPRDKTIYIVFDAHDGGKHVEALVNAHMKAEWLKVQIEETDSPNGKVGKRSIRKSEWVTAG